VVNDFNGTADASGTYPVGTTVVTWTVTDNSGNTNTCAQTITITDNELPTAICQNVTVYLDNTGNASISVTDIDNNSEDNCTIDTMYLDTYNFTCAQVGTNTVMLNVVDASSNTSTCTATVTVSDTISPDLTGISDFNVYADASCEYTLVDYSGLTTASDNCPTGITLTQKPAIGTTISGHSTVQTIWLIADDGHGNYDSTSFSMSLLDTVAPAITSVSDMTVYLDAGCDYELVDYTTLTSATDNCSASISLIQKPASGTIISGHNTVQTVWLIGDDGNGNQDSTSFNITLSDTISPDAQCSDAAVYLDASGNILIDSSFVDGGSTDNCSIATMTLDQYTFDCSQAGLQIINMTVTDPAGNVSTCQAVVDVNDTIRPIAACQDTTIWLNGSGTATINSSFIDGGSTDNCSITSFILSQSSFGCDDLGTKPVNVAITDINGNISMCVANVTVLDIISPVITCPADTSVSAAPGQCTAVVQGIAPDIADNCNADSIVFTLNGATGGSGQDDASGTTFNEGVTTVTYYVWDKSKNTASCSFTVTVSITSVPPTLASSTSDTVCPAVGTITLSYTGGVMPQGGQAHWYNNPALTSHIGSGNNLSIPAPAVESTYYVRFEGTCDTTSAVSITVAVKSLSTAPDSAFSSADTVCSAEGTITLSYGGGVPGTGSNAKWYSDATFSNNIGTGNDLVIPAPSTASDYYVRFEGGCNTTVARSVHINIFTESVAPDSAASDRDTICPGDGTVTLVYYGGSSGQDAVARWYTNTSFTNSIGTGNNLQIPAPLATTDYYVRFEGRCDTTGAVSTRILVEGIAEPPVNALTDRNNVCPGDGMVILTYQGGNTGIGGTAEWYSDNTFSSHTGTGNNLVIPAPMVSTTYYVRFEGLCDTTSAVSTTLSVKASSTAPSSATVDRDTVCPGSGQIVLTYTGGSAGAGATAVWYDNNQFTNILGTGNNLTLDAPLQQTTYFVRFEGECDTTLATAITVFIFPVPAPAFTQAPALICAGSSPVYYIVSGLNGSIFTWSASGGSIVGNTGDTLIIDWGNETGTYSVTVYETTINGCLSDSITASIQVAIPTIDLGNDQYICEGKAAIIVPTGSFTAHQWHDGTSTSTYLATASETVIIYVTDEFGCTATDSVRVDVGAIPVLSFGNDTSLCGSQSMILDAGNTGAVYEWSTGETTQQIEIFPGHQLIWAQVTTSNGCTASDTIFINGCSPKEFFSNIPNGFTPNGDDVNDDWHFDEAAAYPEMVVEVFDRWGRLMFRSTSGYTEPWDGRSLSGKELPMDTYFYVIKLNDGSEDITGTVTIIR
jgi:gliding motility-associated-like protein